MIKINSNHSETESYYTVQILYYFTITVGHWMFDTRFKNMSNFIAFSVFDICLILEFQTNERGAIQLSIRLDTID